MKKWVAFRTREHWEGLLPGVDLLTNPFPLLFPPCLTLSESGSYPDGLTLKHWACASFDINLLEKVEERSPLLSPCLGQFQNLTASLEMPRSSAEKSPRQSRGAKAQQRGTRSPGHRSAH